MKIGDGIIVMAMQIAHKLKMKFNDSISIEIVDEHGTSLPQYAEANRRGIRDKSSARVIAFRKRKELYTKIDFCFHHLFSSKLMLGGMMKFLFYFYSSKIFTVEIMSYMH